MQAQSPIIDHTDGTKKREQTFDAAKERERQKRVDISNGQEDHR